MAKNKRKSKKIRTDFRKKHDERARKRDLTRDFAQDGIEPDELAAGDRMTGKGALTRKRTIIGAEAVEDETGFAVRRDVDESACEEGRVLSVHGLACSVRAEDDGQVLQCAIRGVLKSLSTDLRHVVVAGDRVLFQRTGDEEGVIERVEPRRGLISRASRSRQHIIVSNVDLLVIVGSAAEPTLKPNLIDRFLVTAEKERIKPLICINKIDLIHPADLQPLVGVYGQMGYEVLLASAKTEFGVEALKRALAGKQSVMAGQSGVGKSSLLNAVEPGLHLEVREVSRDSQKGKHTTTTARLLPLAIGGFVVDTPGIRQFELWDVIPEEVAGFYRDVRPYVSLCKFPDCTHTHEADCAVKDAVADGRLDARRYESYCHLFAGN